jgi:hypothetical protein
MRSMVISGHQWRLREAFRGHQRPSVAISGHQRPSVAISGHQWPSEAIRGNQWHSPGHGGEHIGLGRLPIVKNVEEGHEGGAERGKDDVEGEPHAKVLLVEQAADDHVE